MHRNIKPHECPSEVDVGLTETGGSDVHVDRGRNSAEAGAECGAAESEGSFSFVTLLDSRNDIDDVSKMSEQAPEDLWLFGYGYGAITSISTRVANKAGSSSLIWKPPPHYGKDMPASMKRTAHSMNR